MSPLQPNYCYGLRVICFFWFVCLFYFVTNWTSFVGLNICLLIGDIVSAACGVYVYASIGTGELLRSISWFLKK